jgi:hypothetical protein
MNKHRRKLIEEARDLIGIAFSKLEEARSMLGDVKDAEQEAFDNLPESLQGADRGTAMETIIDAIDAAATAIDEFDFDSIFTSLDEAVET